MFPEPQVKGALQAWIKTHPPDATWDTEECRALSYDPEGNDEKVAATGLRNCTGIAIQPATEHPQWGNAFVTLHGSWNSEEVSAACMTAF